MPYGHGMAEEATYTHGHAESVLRSHRWRTVDNSAAYVADRLVPGADVLDVGCGPGTITVDIARRVAPGRVVGLDADANVVDAARAAAAEVGVTNLELVVGDVYAVDRPDDAFDVVHAHQVLQHVADPVAALREMRRVCRPGGVVAARDSIYRAMSWHPPDSVLDRWLAVSCAVTDANGGDPDAGCRLRSWALAAGFGAVVASASAWCYASDAERGWWGDLWAERVESTSIGVRAAELGLADVDELTAMGNAWRRWAVAPDGWFAVLHGEILATP